MNIDIGKLINLLPSGYKEACFQTKAIERKRTVQTPEELLVMDLYYLYGASLVETSQMASMNGIGRISGNAFMKRFAKSKEWFRWITGNIKPSKMAAYGKPEKMQPYNVVAIDASDVHTKGAAKRTWHLHYSVELFSLNCSQFRITEEKTGETLKNFTAAKNDLIIAGRAYATTSGIEHCLDSGGDFILRIRNKAFNPCNEKKERTALTERLRTPGEGASDIAFVFWTAKTICARLEYAPCRKPPRKYKRRIRS